MTPIRSSTPASKDSCLVVGQGCQLVVRLSWAEMRLDRVVIPLVTVSAVSMLPLTASSHN